MTLDFLIIKVIIKEPIASSPTEREKREYRKLNQCRRMNGRNKGKQFKKWQIESTK